MAADPGERIRLSALRGNLRARLNRDAMGPADATAAVVSVKAWRTLSFGLAKSYPHSTVKAERSSYRTATFVARSANGRGLFNLRQSRKGDNSGARPAKPPATQRWPAFPWRHGIGGAGGRELNLVDLVLLWEPGMYPVSTAALPACKRDKYLG